MPIFLLGEDCLDLDAVDVEGMSVARSSFEQVLLFHKQIRKAREAYMNGGLDYLAALWKAWSNDEIRVRHLISVAASTAVAPRRRLRSPRSDLIREWYKAQKGKGKSKDGVTGKGKSKEGKCGDRSRGEELKAATIVRGGMASRVTASAAGCTRGANVTACTSGLIAPKMVSE